MLNVSKVDTEIKTIPPGWHFEAGEKMIYCLARAFTGVRLRVFKGTIKCNQVAVNSKHFVWPLHPRRGDGSCTET